MPTSNFVTVNGLKLHFLDYGDPGKPVLVCVHGLSGNAHNFDALVPHLSSDYHVLSVDVRGRGDSQWGPPMEYTTPVYANDLAGMLDALEIERVSLIGTSMGGVISMVVAGSEPNRVERLVLNDIGPEIDPAGANRITSYMTAPTTDFADMDEVAKYYRENYPALREIPQRELIEFAKWSVKPTADGKLTWKMDPAVRTMRRRGNSASFMDLWVPYVRITAKVLIVRGTESDILSPAIADRMRKVLPGVEMVEVPGVGHAPSLLEPAALSAVTKFLAR